MMGLMDLIAAGVASAALAMTPVDGSELEDKILEQSAKNQVVMFGEVHYLKIFNSNIAFTQDNLLVTNIFPELKKQGFEYLALELPRDMSWDPHVKILQDYIAGKINASDISTSDRNYLDLFIGGWIELVDGAKEAGFKIIQYDADDDIITDSYRYDEREETAFKNIKEMIFDKDPEAKVIVYCGNNHIKTEDGKLKVKDHLVEFIGDKIFAVSFTSDYNACTGGCDLTINPVDGWYHFTPSR